MSSTGAKAPGTATTTAEAPWSDDAWTNVANIYGAGEASVTATSFDAGDQTEVLKAFNFDFTALSTTATIQGLTCTINARYASDVASIDLVQALGTARDKTGTNMAASATALSTAAANYTFGGATNTWGNSLTPAWLKDTDFGVAIGCIAGGGGNNNVDVYIDTVTINVYYTELVTADAGSFTLGGQDASPKVGRKLTADAGSYAVTGNDATFQKGMKFIADAGSYSCTGNDAVMKVTRKLPADAGSYVLAGQDAALKYGYKLAAGAGTYTYSGQDATLTYTPTSTAHWTLSASSYITASGEDTTAQLTPPAGKTVSDFQAGRIADDENPLDAIDLAANKYTELEWSIKPTEQAARGEVWEFRVTIAGTPLTSYTSTPTVTLTSSFSMTADGGSYSVTGQDASLKAGRKIVAEAGSYSATGNDATMKVGRKVAADAGTYTYTGNAAGIYAGRRFVDELGQYTYTGFDATLTYTGKTHYSLSLDAGAYLVTGNDATIKVARKLAADAGQYTYTGADAGVYHGFVVTAEAGAYTQTGNDATIEADRYLSGGAGAYTYTGQSAGFTRQSVYSPTSRLISVRRNVIYADQRNEIDVKRTTIKAE